MFPELQNRQYPASADLESSMQYFSHPSSKRIIEHGFTPGQTIEIINKSTFNDPIAVSIRGTIIAIRKSEAGCIKLK